MPVAWDSTYSPLRPVGSSIRWSAVGLNDANHRLSLAIYNQSAAATTYTVRVYAADGSNAAQSVTASIPAAGGADGAGATRGFLLTDVIGRALTQGILKVTWKATGSPRRCFSNLAAVPPSLFRCLPSSFPPLVRRSPPRKPIRALPQPYAFIRSGTDN